MSTVIRLLSCIPRIVLTQLIRIIYLKQSKLSKVSQVSSSRHSGCCAPSRRRQCTLIEFSIITQLTQLVQLTNSIRLTLLLTLVLTVRALCYYL